MSYEVKVVRLLNEQDLLAKVSIRREDGRKKYILKDAVLIQIQKINVDKSTPVLDPNAPPKPDVEYKIGLAPYKMPYVKQNKEITIDEFHVLYLDEPEDQLLEKYNMLTSGLYLPQGAVK